MFYQVLRELKTLDPRSAVCGIQLILSQTSYARSGLKRLRLKHLYSTEVNIKRWDIPQ